MKKKKTFPLELEPSEHEALRLKARSADVPMYQYIKDMALHGKVQKKKP